MIFAPYGGYTRIKDYIVYLGYKIGETTVKNILIEAGYDPEPDRTCKTTWKEFIKSHWSVLAACDLLSVELLIKDRLVRCLVLFAIELSTRRVEILGVRPQPDCRWMEQIARNATGEDGFLASKKYLIHDRDPLYTTKFQSILKGAGGNLFNSRADDFMHPTPKVMYNPSRKATKKGLANERKSFIDKE
jgi:putative transposase